jgi:two-component system, chemotaxis family, protein-glutamate methylesterase/glutaminase
MKIEHPIRILIVDDSVTYRKIVGDALACLPDVEVVGIAANGKIALQKIEQLHPDLLTLDLEMPEMDGLELLRQIKSLNAEVHAIMLSGATAQGAKATMQALELGAFDFVPKPTSGTIEENTIMLRQNLSHRIRAFACTQQVRTILHGSGSTPHASVAARPSYKKMSAVPRTTHTHFKRAGRPEIVAIGISTGGPPALIRMLPRLPADLNVPVLIVQHMPPVFTKSLADDLDRRCGLTVCEATHGERVLPGHVYIAPGGKQMRVDKMNEGVVIQITDDPPENSCKPSVDYLFRSVAEVYGGNSIGVIMTGMGSDGTRGCKEMKKCGASLIAQDEATSVVFGMPKILVEEGMADMVAPLDSIAAEIVRIIGKGV